MYKILLATDGSSNSFRAAEEVSRLAGLLQAEVTVIIVIQNIPMSTMPEEIYKALDNYSQTVLERTRSLLEDKGLKVSTLSYRGNPGNIICEVAEEGDYDLIVMGNSGLGSVEGLFLGAVSNKVVHSSKTSVMIVK